MKWSDVQKHLTQFNAEVQAQWPKITTADLTTINGKRSELVAKVVHYEGVSEEQADADVKAWEKKTDLPTA